MRKAIIYHNPKCSKSRLALAFLKQNNVNVEIIDYIKNKLCSDQIKKIMLKLDGPIHMIRFNEAVSKTLNIKKDAQKSIEQWSEILRQHPILIQRPIVIINHKAIIARPPEKVLALLKFFDDQSR